MSVSLTNSVDIVANSISIIGPDGQLISLTEAIEGGVSVVQGNLTPDQLQDLSSLSTALNNDPNYFTTVTNQLEQKADKSTTYTKTEIDNTLLTNYDTKTGVNTKISTAISNLVDSAPDTLNTLNELAAAIGDDANYVTTITSTVTSINTSGPLTGGPITGSGTIGITQATTSTNGYLSSTDWTTFNNKGSGNGTVTSVASGTGLSGGPITTTGTMSVDLPSNVVVTGSTTIGTFMKLIPGSAPTSPSAGMVYYDSGSNTLKCYNGTAWKTITMS